MSNPITTCPEWLHLEEPHASIKGPLWFPVSSSLALSAVQATKGRKGVSKQPTELYLSSKEPLVRAVQEALCFQWALRCVHLLMEGCLLNLYDN